MLINRAIIIAALMILGFLVLCIGAWLLAANPASSMAATWSGPWFLQRAPIAVGLLMLVTGFRMLSGTNVPKPMMTDDDPAP